MVTVRSVPLYLAQVDATMRAMRADPAFPCLLREARRVDGLFRMAPPLDAETRAEIALHEWVAEGGRLTLAMARRAKRAILNVGAYSVIRGLADAWGSHWRRPVVPETVRSQRLRDAV
jgi:hypothetical protein